MKKVAITFDDGPNGQYTLQTLKTLREYDIKAAFFFPARNMERQPHIARQAQKEGHLIGNHTYSHPHLSRLDYYEINWQISKSEEVFEEVLGIYPKFFRAPYGECDDGIEEILRSRLYNIADWDRDCYSKDWRDISAEEIRDISTEKAKDGSIILLHDGRNIKKSEPRNNMLNALPDIISTLRKKGFKIVRLDKLLCKD